MTNFTAVTKFTGRPVETGELLVLFCVEVFGFLKIFILCASLSLNFESRKNASWKDCVLEKSLIDRIPNPHCISEIPPMKINPQH